MGLLSAIFGGGGAYKKGIRDLEGARDKELAYWERLAYSDPLQNSENQAALRQARELLKSNTQRTMASAAVTGATGIKSNTIMHTIKIMIAAAIGAL